MKTILNLIWLIFGGFWLAMSCASATLIYLLEANGLAQPLTPRTDMPLLHLVCDLGLYVVVLVFVLLFELTKNDGFSRLRQALTTINELAIRDELTGIHNRRFLLDLVEKEKERADRNGSEFCLCLFDIDFFKRINDTYGHAAGDAVLRDFARTVQEQLRALDAFGLWRRRVPADAARDAGRERDRAGRTGARRGRRPALP